MNSESQLSNIIALFKENLDQQYTTDQIFEQFFGSLLEIEKEHSAHTALISHLKMMRSIGSYLKSNRTAAHPDAVSDLSAIFENTKQLTANPDLPRPDMRSLFDESYALFKELKRKVASPSIFSQNDITELSSAILAIDWEITDETISSFDQVVSGLLSKTRPDTIFHSFLKIMQSLGGYVKTKKASAIIESVTFLKSVFKNFERIVLSSELDLNEKKQILKADIQQFKQIKKKIEDQKTQPDTPKTSADEFAPALSHVQSKTSPEPSSDLELTELPEDRDDSSSESLNEYEDIQPALSDKKKDPAQGPSVMDDLFNAKESPADELLDAIHLMDVHGNENQALKMLDESDEQRQQGIQNFTPQRIDTTPIPEINDRLDAFFDLEKPAPPTPQADFPPVDTPADDASGPPAQVSADLEETDQPAADPGIIPFDDGDENLYSDEPAAPLPDEQDQQSFEPQMPGAISSTPSTALEDDLPAPPVDRLEKLQSFLLNQGWETDQWCLQSIQKECFHIKDTWPDEKELAQTLDIILSLSRALEEYSQQNQDDSNPPEQNRTESKGFFARLKGMFSS